MIPVLPEETENYYILRKDYIYKGTLLTPDVPEVREYLFSEGSLFPKPAPNTLIQPSVLIIPPSLARIALEAITDDTIVTRRIALYRLEDEALRKQLRKASLQIPGTERSYHLLVTAVKDKSKNWHNACEFSELGLPANTGRDDHAQQKNAEREQYSPVLPATAKQAPLPRTLAF